MNYCENCKCLINKDTCPVCSQPTREIKETDFCFLVEHEEIQAKMIIEMLDKENIKHIEVNGLGAGMTLRTGAVERVKIYVPYDCLKKAQEII